MIMSFNEMVRRNSMLAATQYFRAMELANSKVAGSSNEYNKSNENLSSSKIFASYIDDIGENPTYDLLLSGNFKTSNSKYVEIKLSTLTSYSDTSFEYQTSNLLSGSMESEHLIYSNILDDVINSSQLLKAASVTNKQYIVEIKNDDVDLTSICTSGFPKLAAMNIQVNPESLSEVSVSINYFPLSLDLSNFYLNVYHYDENNNLCRSIYGVAISCYNFNTISFNLFDATVQNQVSAKLSKNTKYYIDMIYSVYDEKTKNYSETVLIPSSDLSIEI